MLFHLKIQIKSEYGIIFFIKIKRVIGILTLEKHWAAFTDPARTLCPSCPFLQVWVLRSPQDVPACSSQQDSENPKPETATCPSRVQWAGKGGEKTVQWAK